MKPKTEAIANGTTRVRGRTRQLIVFPVIILSCLLSVWSTPAFGQAKEKQISGTVLTSENHPLAGVVVLIKGTNRGTTTDARGRFSLRAAEGEIISVTMIGFKDNEFTVDKRDVYSFVIEEEATLVDDVVVVGYGTQKKVNLTGAVDQIKGDALADRSATSVSMLLQGQVPGLTGFTTGEYGFEPGAQLDFSVRGQGSAYVLIDGVEGDMNRLNPADIESISVLKDAAASAIYGARATYGVILITTKAGRISKPTVTFNFQQSYTKACRMPSMVDSYTYALAVNEAGINSGAAQPYKDDHVDRILAYMADPTLPETVPLPNGNWHAGNANYDWYDEYFGGFGKRNQQNFQVQGGTKDVRYMVSVGHYADDGLIKYGTDKYSRLNLNSKFDANLTNWWTFSSNTLYSRTNREFPAYDSQGNYDLLMHQLARTPPFQALKTPNGYYTIQSKVPWTQDAGTETNIGNSFTQRLATQINFTKNWKLNADFSFRIENWQWERAEFTVYEDKVDGSLSASGTTIPPNIAKTQTAKAYYTTNIYSSYDFSINKAHNFHLMAGFQYEDSQDEAISGTKKGIISNSVPSFSTSTGEITLGDELNWWATQGIFARFGYNYKERYLFEANMRYDGTSKFAKDHAWGTFPSFSAGWNIAKENFMKKHVKVIDMLKLRASWGQIGNQNVAAYQDLPLLGTNSNLGWIINGSRPDYTTAPQEINPNLTWETSETADIGIDIAAFKNRFTLTADIYQRMTRDRLGPAEARPATLGATLPKANNSTLRTRGWELSVGWRSTIGKDFIYNVSAMVSDYQSVVTRFNNPTKILTTDYEGKVIGEIWGFETDGFIYTQEEADRITADKSQSYFSNEAWQIGDIRYKDLDGVAGISAGDNTVFNPGDRKIIGNTTPRYQFGLNFGAQYKGFDFSMLWQGVLKRDMFLTGSMFWGFGNSGQENLFPVHMDYFRDKEQVIRNSAGGVETIYSGLGINNIDPYFPKPYRTATRNAKNQQVQTKYMQNGAYARLKNLQVGYTFPKKWMDKIYMQNIRIFFSGENLWTITAKNFHTPLDPETADKGRRGNGKSYFSQTIFSFGADIKF